MLSKFAFRVDISSKIGMGHYRRLLSFKDRLNLKNIFWILSGEKKIINFFFNKKKNLFYINNFYDEVKACEILKKKNIEKVIMDISHTENIKNNKINLIQNLYKERNIHIISFDDPRHKINSDISIIPYDYKKKKLNILNKKCKSFIGTNYFFFPKKFDKFLGKKKKIIKKPDKILIAISGTDQNNIGIKITNLISNLNLQIKLLPGQNKNLTSLKKNSDKIKIIKFSSSIEKVIKWCDIAIVGEGLIKYEIALFNTPCLIAHHKDISSELIKKFLSLKTAVSLGKYKNNLSNSFKEKIISYINNFKLRNLNSKNSLKSFNYKKLLDKQKKLIKIIKSN